MRGGVTGGAGLRLPFIDGSQSSHWLLFKVSKFHHGPGNKMHLLVETLSCSLQFVCSSICHVAMNTFALSIPKKDKSVSDVSE